MQTFLNSTLNICLSSALLVGISGALIYLLNDKRKREYIGVAVVNKLIIYPVKSLSGIEIDRALIGKSGLKFGPFHDRSWMLIDGESRCITQRQESTLALLKPSFHNDCELWINGPNLPTLKVTFKQKCSSDDVIINTKVWGQEIQGIYCGKEAEEWFSNFLGKPGIRLLQHTPDLTERASMGLVKNDMKELNQYPILYQDGSGLLLINSSSIEDLNTRLSADTQVSYRNFRPNIYISNCDSFEEDKWKSITINNIKLLCLMPCTRCVLTTVNPDTGVRTNQEPLDTLRKYRLGPKHMKKQYGNSPLFGINFAPQNDGEIHVGDIISAVY